MTETNIVIFPKEKRNTPAQSLDELIETVNTSKKEHIEYLVDEAMGFIFNRVGDDGFNLTSEECIGSTGLLIEAFKAALYKSVGLEHPLHEVAESEFTFISEMDFDNFGPGNTETTDTANAEVSVLE